MSDIDPALIKQQAFGSPKPAAAGATEAAQHGNALGTSPNDDLTGTDNKIEVLQDSEDPSPRRRKLTEPKQSVDQAIEDGRSLAEIEALQEEWNAYNRQEVFRRLAEQKKALAERIKDERRKYAEQLLAIADEYGVTIADARDIFRAALKRKFPDRAKGDAK